MSKLAEGTTTRYFCCKIQADGLNFESIMLSTGKGRKRWDHTCYAWYILIIYVRFTTKCPEVQSIHKWKIRTHRDQVLFILCHGAYTTQPPMLGLLMTWEWNAIKLCILKYPVLKYRWYPTCNYPVNNKSYSGNDWCKTYSMCCRS